ncbi:1 2-dihydroxy-3-keto-5-methylthiopentene dioxygenase [Trichostrongylus colubriformis]|uniref:Probable inactive acireductone dioxygenase n=1 Tax=Trichostrongylus colubriformis TaxID=6319 RepID=A0AAN8F937_TRICO
MATADLRGLNMQIWHMEPYPCGDRRLPHHVFPPKKLTADQLHTLLGVVYYKVDLDDTVAMKKRLSRVKSERKVVSSDVLTVSDKIPDFNEKLEDYYEPVKKEQDVVSMVLDGTCYYDVEQEEDEWIRIQLERGDLIVIPQGVSHRFTVTPQNYVQIQRFFPKKPDNVQG